MISLSSAQAPASPATTRNAPEDQFCLDVAAPAPSTANQHAPEVTSAKLVCQIRIQLRRFTKNEHVNFERTNPRTAKYHSVDMGDTLRGSSTAILRLAARKLYGILTESTQNVRGIRRIS